MRTPLSRAFIGAAMLLVATGVSAQAVIYGPGGPYWGYGSSYGGYGCTAYPCPDARDLRRDLRRELRQEDLRQQGSAPAPPPDRPRALPPPTRAEEIRPEYEGASQVRDEYRGSGAAR